MLQVNVLRQNAGWVKERLAVKNFKQLDLVDEIVALDDKRKKLQLEFDNTQAKINSSSKDIGKLMGQGKKEEAEALKAAIPQLKTALEPIKEEMQL